MTASSTPEASTNAASVPALGYYLGLPAWGFPGWTGEYFPRPAGGVSTLAHYASVFNTVEGNTTFYRVPERDTVENWGRAVAGTDFRFSFKIPQVVTHERSPDWGALRDFMTVMEPLGRHLGPFLVQCPARLAPADLPRLERLFDQLPSEHDYVLELRHLDFFSQPERAEPLLEKCGAGRVMFDSRPIYQGDTQHPEVLAARHKKPDVPLLDTVYNDIVYARVVLHPDPRYNGKFVAEWLERMKQYLDAGYQTFFMMHCPNNQHCPSLADEFHGLLREGCNLPPLPPWPMPQQDSLF